MRNSLKVTGALALALALAGCFDSSSNGGGSSPDPQVSFVTFVEGEINNTADDREAVDINEKEFTFNDQDNEQAFDSLF